MTNEELFTDLKQFIEATVSQQTANLATKEELQNLATKADTSRLEKRLDGIDQKLDEVQDAVADTLVYATETQDAKMQDHERRLTALESKMA